MRLAPAILVAMLSAACSPPAAELTADTARRLVGTDGSRELLVRPRDVARFEGWGDYAARLMLTRPDEITDELWQHALEILAGERPDLPF